MEDIFEGTFCPRKLKRSHVFSQEIGSAKASRPLVRRLIQKIPHSGSSVKIMEKRGPDKNQSGLCRFTQHDSGRGQRLYIHHRRRRWIPKTSRQQLVGGRSAGGDRVCAAFSKSWVRSGQQIILYGCCLDDLKFTTKHKKLVSALVDNSWNVFGEEF